jgi:hypothetical protein
MSGEKRKRAKSKKDEHIKPWKKKKSKKTSKGK